MTAYLTSDDDDFDDITDTVAGVDADFLADDDLDKWLAEASERIDTAMKYQGRKFDPTQEREFPRIAYSSGLIEQPLYVPYPANVAAGEVVWDWDSDGTTAIVPERVRRACLIEAESMWDGKRASRQDAMHDGLASQSIGSASESYKQAAGGPPPAICRRAHELMSYYLLRSGQLL